jgi:hypothetical protein
MELSSQEKSSIYWQAALHGAANGIWQGLLIGTIAAVALLGACTAFPALTPAFGSFIFFGGAGFNPIPLLLFNTVLSAAGNFVLHGAQAVEAAEKSRASEVVQSTRAAPARAHTPEHAPNVPAHVQKILLREAAPSSHTERVAQSAATHTGATLH